VHLLVDSTGLKLSGAGDWLVEKHGTSRRRSWRKLHVGVDGRWCTCRNLSVFGGSSHSGSELAPDRPPSGKYTNAHHVECRCSQRKHPPDRCRAAKTRLAQPAHHLILTTALHTQYRCGYARSSAPGRPTGRDLCLCRSDQGTARVRSEDLLQASLRLRSSSKHIQLLGSATDTPDAPANGRSRPKLVIGRTIMRSQERTFSAAGRRRLCAHLGHRPVRRAIQEPDIRLRPPSAVSRPWRSFQGTSPSIECRRSLYYGSGHLDVCCGRHLNLD
jgi:hypothetical protein